MRTNEVAVDFLLEDAIRFTGETNNDNKKKRKEKKGGWIIVYTRIPTESQRQPQKQREGHMKDRTIENEIKERSKREKESKNVSEEVKGTVKV